MATGVLSWSTTAADNDDADSAINWLEGQPPSTVNNSARAMMAELKKWIADNNGTVTTGGSSNAYTVATNNSYSALVDGTMILVEANHTNTGATTLNVDSVGAVAVVRDTDVALAGGEIQSGGRYILSYDSGLTKWLLLNPTAALIGSANTFTADQKIEHTAASVTHTVEKTSGARWQVYAQASKVLKGTWTNHALGTVVNGTEYWINGNTAGSLYAADLAEPGTAGLINAKGLLVNNTAIPFQEKFESAEIAIPTTSSTTYAHGLSAIPIAVQAVLRCKITEHGYIVGAEVPLISNDNSNTTGGSAYAQSATHVGLVMAGNLPTVRTTAGVSIITAANWRVVIRAWV